MDKPRSSKVAQTDSSKQPWWMRTHAHSEVCDCHARPTHAVGAMRAFAQCGCAHCRAELG